MASSTPKKRKKVLITEDSEMLITHLMDEFIGEKKADGRSAKTIESYVSSFAKFTDYFGEDFTIGNLTRSTIYQYKGHLQSVEELSLGSINHYLRDLRTFVNWLDERALLGERIKVELVKGQENQKEVYTDEELQKLLAKPHSGENFAMWRTWAIINWILATGSRASTIINVKIGDVHFSRKEIVIREQKNKKPDIIPLSAKLSSVLKTYLKKTNLIECSDNTYLFCNQYEEPLTVGALQKAIRTYNKKRGVERTSVHALRHTFAKNWVVNGGDVFRLQKLLGHSTLEMTRKYVNLFGADLKKDYEDFSPLDTMTRTHNTGKKAKVKTILEDF